MAEDRDKGSPESHCPLESNCAMYELFKLAGMQGVWQALYCHGTYSRCERFRNASAGKQVPTHLLPDGKLLKLSRRPPKP